MFLKSAVRGKMFLDCFQLGLEKVKLFESVNRPNTTGEGKRRNEFAEWHVA